MDVAIKKAYTLIQKLQKKYGIRHPDHAKSSKKASKDQDVFISKVRDVQHLHGFFSSVGEYWREYISSRCLITIIGCCPPHSLNR